MVVDAALTEPAAAEKPAAVAMTELICTSLWLGRLLPLAAELRIADRLADGPRTAAELASATGANGDALARGLRALASVGIFADDGTGAYVNTALSATLREDAPVSLNALARLWGAPGHLKAWDALGDAVRSDGSKPAWELAHGLSLFDYFAAHPDDAALFQRSMTAFSGVEAAAVAAAYDFAGIGTLVDVGGGHGVMLAAILEANPSVRGILFELPFMVEGARTVLGERGVADRCAIAVGDFFQGVPEADAHILKNIVHDFEDEQATAILSSCRRAVAPGGRLLVVQEALPPGNAPSFGKLLDVQMLVIGGRERTEDEYSALFDAAGYELARVVPTQGPQHVLEGIAR